MKLKAIIEYELNPKSCINLSLDETDIPITEQNRRSLLVFLSEAGKLLPISRSRR